MAEDRLVGRVFEARIMEGRKKGTTATNLDRGSKGSSKYKRNRVERNLTDSDEQEELEGQIAMYARRGSINCRKLIKIMDCVVRTFKCL